MSGRRFVERCPVGCDTPLEPTDNLQPEGALLRCAGCGQLISQCTEAQLAKHFLVDHHDVQWAGFLP